MRLSLSFLLIMLVGSVFAQKHTVTGYIEDSKTGEKLFGANVYEKQTLQGTTSNEYGFYSITLPEGSVTVVVSFVGYSNLEFAIDLKGDTTLSVELGGAVELREFEVVASQTEKIHEETQMSKISIPISEIENLPAFLGEKDVLKTIQLLPGVQSGGEGSSGLYVRGGGPDQNLILLDGVPVYNASHLFGFFSVFNPDGINSVELIKGGFPAHYGGRLSSVVDIRMKEGNMKEFHGSGGIGVVSSRLTLEGPIVKDKSSFIVSGRRTYIDILAQPIIRAAGSAQGVKTRAGYYFYDLNAKANWKFSENSRLFLSSYMGNDKAYFRIEESYLNNDVEVTEKNDADLVWGNITTALRWNQIVGKKLFANTTLTYSRYRFLVGSEFETETEGGASDDQKFRFAYNSGIFDWGGKVDFDYRPSPNHYIKFGVGNTYHTYVPGITIFREASDNTDVDTTFGATKIYSHESVIYAEDDIKIGTRLKVNLGAHFSAFKVRDEWFTSLQPRVSGRYLLTEDWALKGSYATMQQYIHLLTNATIGLPTDLWVPATDKAPPQRSEQVALGVAKTYRDKFEISVEGYYKTMKNLIEYKEGASFFSTQNDWEEKIESGDGWSYGTELFIQKKMGKTRGWIGYTLSWTERQFDNINFGEKFPYKFDRRHDLSIAVTHKFNDKIDIGVTWVYGTGNAVTLAQDRYLSNPFSTGGGEFFENSVENFDSRNDYRMAAFHRLDVGVNFRKEKRWGERTWSLGLYNAYSRKNPFYLYFTTTNSGKRVLKQVSLFPIIPSVSYGFKF